MGVRKVNLHLGVYPRCFPPGICLGFAAAPEHGRQIQQDVDEDLSGANVPSIDSTQD